MPSRPACRSAAKVRYGLHAGSGQRISARVACSEPGLESGMRVRAERFRCDHATYTGASKPGTSRLYELTHCAKTAAISRACRSCPAMKALPVSERCQRSSASKNAFRPSVKSDWCVCIPEPFSPKSGFGMKVAWKAAFFERLCRVGVLEEEVLELGADVEAVEAERAHPLERAPQDVARVALVGLPVRRDDVADHPRDLRLARLPRHELERVGIGDRDHVRLFDRVEAGDRRAVEAHAVVERVLDFARRDREALQVPLDVGEPEED